MTANEFVMWLKGFADFSDSDSISDENWVKIKGVLHRVSAQPTLPLGGAEWYPPTSTVRTYPILTCSLSQPRIGFRNGDDS